MAEPDLTVATYHHQAVNRLGTGLVATGWATDGIVEAIELPGHAFAVGVQWQPEEDDDRRLFKALVAAAADKAARVSAGPRHRPARGRRRSSALPG
jgi:gamma-glutamyl-gamma-aminobutyrate hydrolase PuuD